MFALPTSLLILGSLLFVLCLAALWFYGYTLYATFDYLSHQDGTIDPDFHPPITILKPLSGLSPNLRTNLVSFCQQDYAKYQIIFAVQQATDPSVAVVHELMQQFPKQDIQLVVGNWSERNGGFALQADCLTHAAAAAKYEIWVLADSSVRVGRDYLRQVVQPLRYPGVGVVTCPYRSQAMDRSATLMALSAATERHPEMLLARKLDRVNCVGGRTIAIRKTIVEKLGGLATLAGQDQRTIQWGKLLAGLGYRVCLSHYIVEYIGEPGSSRKLLEVLQQQVQWVRGMGAVQPWGYGGKVATYGTVMSLLLLLVSNGSLLGWTMVALTWSVRLLTVMVISIVWLKDRPTQRYWWLLPLYDLLSFGIWCYEGVRYGIEWHRGQSPLSAASASPSITAPTASQDYASQDYLPVLEKI